MDKLRHLIIGAILIFSFNTEVCADGVPVVQAFIAKGNYLLILENSGLYTIHKKDGRFNWEFDRNIYHFFEVGDGELWGISRPDEDSNRAWIVVSGYNGDSWTEYPFPKINPRNYVRIFKHENECS